MVDTPGGIEAFRELAPRYGMNMEEFIKESGGQLIPAELCAAGLVGTILHAKEFHGQETGYAIGLMKLGLDAAGEYPRNQVLVETPHDLPRGQASEEVSDLCREALTLNRKMETILRDNIREYSELNLFQRPIVKRMFQQGTGLKVEDWLASAEWMTRCLSKAVENGEDLKALIGSDKLAAYISQLNRMVGFITRQESEARGWIGDPEKLRIAIEALHGRNETVCKLAKALTVIQGGELLPSYLHLR